MFIVSRGKCLKRSIRVNMIVSFSSFSIPASTYGKLVERKCKLLASITIDELIEPSKKSHWNLFFFWIQYSTKSQLKNIGCSPLNLRNLTKCVFYWMVSFVWEGQNFILNQNGRFLDSKRISDDNLQWQEWQVHHLAMIPQRVSRFSLI